MPNYKQSTVTGESYQRCAGIIMNNKRGATPNAAFEEETVVTIGDQTIAQEVGGFTTYFSEDGVIELKDPLTGNDLRKTATHAELFTILWSLYQQESGKARCGTGWRWPKATRELPAAADADRV